MKGSEVQKALNRHTSKLRELCPEAGSSFSTDCKKGSDLAEAVAGLWVLTGSCSSTTLYPASHPDRWTTRLCVG